MKRRVKSPYGDVTLAVCPVDGLVRSPLRGLTVEEVDAEKDCVMLSSPEPRDRGRGVAAVT